MRGDGTGIAGATAGAVRRLHSADQAVFDAVARIESPRLDPALRALTSAADHSHVWLLTAAGMAALGGADGRRAAVTGVVSIGAASATANLVVKRAFRRQRPDRELSGVPEGRHVPLPTSASLPSGHSASAFAFATGVTGVYGVAGVPLWLAAGLVAYTRVHSGVHYPGDVLAGSLIGVGCGVAVTRVLGRRH